MTLAPQITFRNMNASPRLEEAVLNEAGRLDRFFPRIMSCRVAIEAPRRHEYDGLLNVRIDLGVPGDELVVEHIEATREAEALEPRRKRRDARRTIHAAFVEMRRRLQDYAHRLRQETRQRENLPAGKVTHISPENGFGFIETEDGQDVYFHRNSVLAGDFDRLRLGSGVRFGLDSGEKGPRASTVRLLRASRPRPSA